MYLGTKLNIILAGKGKLIMLIIAIGIAVTAMALASDNNNPVEAQPVPQVVEPIVVEPVAPVVVVEEVKPKITPTNPSIVVTPSVIGIEDSISISGIKFAVNSPLTIAIGDHVFPQIKANDKGVFTTTLRIPNTLGTGNYDLTITDITKGQATTRLIIKPIGVTEPAPAKPNEPAQPVVNNINSLEDRYPPYSNHTIAGKQTCTTVNTVERCWYYDTYPAITFTGGDDISGLRHIVIQGRVSAQDCRQNQCYVHNNTTVEVRYESAVNNGNVKLTYFAVDKQGNIEQPKDINIWVDLQAPQLTIREIISDIAGRHPIQYSDCDPRTPSMLAQQAKNFLCYPIKLQKNEQVTFKLLAGDRISGLHKVEFRQSIVGKSINNEAWQVLTDSPNALPEYSTYYERNGSVIVQFKASDIAGNLSKIITLYVLVQ